jgi:hypothetical protein
VPDDSGQGQQALQDPGMKPVGTPAVTFQLEVPLVV